MIVLNEATTSLSELYISKMPSFVEPQTLLLSAEYSIQGFALLWLETAAILFTLGVSSLESGN